MWLIICTENADLFVETITIAAIVMDTKEQEYNFRLFLIIFRSYCKELEAYKRNGLYHNFINEYNIPENKE